MRGFPLYMEWPPGPVKAGATNQDRYSGYTFNLKPGEGGRDPGGAERGAAPERTGLVCGKCGRVGGKAFDPVGRMRALTYVPFFAN